MTKQQQSLAVIILAAGRGTRMRSSLPKVMHKLAGRPMINWLIESVEHLNPEKIIVVVGPDMDDLKEAVNPHQTVLQETQQGTGDAVKPAMAALKDFQGKVLVLLGDEPILDHDCLEKMVNHDGIAAMAFETESPFGYGRMIQNDDGTLAHIVEEKDCTPAQQKITLCNGGNYCFPDAQQLASWLGQLKNDNAQKEYVLTDVPSIAQKEGHTTQIFATTAPAGWGINNRAQLAAHEAIIQERLRQKAMEAGVTFLDPQSVTLSWDTQFGQDVTIEPSVFIGSGVTIEDNVTIHAFSHLEGVHIEAGAQIGPFARIRPKSKIGKKASVGNFIEVNRSVIKDGAKAKHVSYLGDAVIGTGSNIGAGTIIANYDGFFKHETVMGENVFVGSNSTIIAPAEIGDGAIIAAGSNVNKDVPANAMAIGRSRQENHENWASEYRAMKQQQKKER